METNLSIHAPEGYYQLYKYIGILTEAQIKRLSHIAMGMLDLSDFSAEEISLLEEKITLQNSEYGIRNSEY